MSLQHTGALGACLYLVVLVLVVTGPGAAVGWFLRLRGVALWGAAAPLSVSVVAVGGIVAAKLGLHWTPAVFLTWCVVVVVVAAVIGHWLVPRPAAPADSRGVALAAGLGTVVAGLTVAVSFRLGAGSLRSVPSQPDAMYHLNQIRHMLATRDISSLTASGVLHDHGGGFYPAAWHGLAVTALQIAPIEIAIASNLLAMVAAAIVWSAGCVLLARQALGPRPVVTAAAAIFSVGFTAMPYLLSAYGTLLPNLLGMALVPALVAAVASLLGLGVQDAFGGRRRAALVLVGGLPGLFFAHPSGVATLVLLTFAILVVEVPRWGLHRRREHPMLFVGSLLVVVAIPVLWALISRVPQVRNLKRYYNFPPDESLRRALSEVVLQNPRYGAPLWILGGLTIVGLVVAIRRPRDRWQVAVWVAGWAVFVGVAAFQDGISRAVTGIWYNNSPRLAAITPIGSLVLATSGFVWLRDALARWLERRPAGGSARPVGRKAVALGLTPVLLAGYVVLTGGNYVREHAARVKPYVHPAHGVLLTSREYAALQRLGPRVPAGALVADNPWRGQSLLYAIGGARVLYYSEKADNTPQRDLIAKELYLAGDESRPDVCAAVRQTGIDYVITGGANFLPDHQRITHYPGVDQAAGAPGFQLVATSAPYSLWRITACGHG